MVGFPRGGGTGLYSGTIYAEAAGGEVWVDPAVGKDQSDAGFDQFKAGTRDYPFKSVGTRVGTNTTDGAMPFIERNNLTNNNFAPVAVMIRAGARNVLAYTAAGPPPVFGTWAGFQPRVLQLAEQIVVPFGVSIICEGAPSDDAGTAMRAGAVFVPSSAFPAATGLIKTGKSGALRGLAFVNTQTGGIGADASGNSGKVIDCTAYRCQVQGLVIAGNGCDNFLVRGGWYRENDQSVSGVAAIELVDQGGNAPNHVTIDNIDGAGNTSGVVRFLTAGGAGNGGYGNKVINSRLHGASPVRMQGFNGTLVDGNYFEVAPTADAFILVDRATGGTTENMWPHWFNITNNYLNGSDSATLPSGKAQWVNVYYGASGLIQGNFGGVNSTDVSAFRPIFRFAATTRGLKGDFRMSSYSSTFGALTIAQTVQDAGTFNYGVWHDLANSKDALWGTAPV